jgi:hypothetical protein
LDKQRNDSSDDLLFYDNKLLVPFAEALAAIVIKFFFN